MPRITGRRRGGDDRQFGPDQRTGCFAEGHRRAGHRRRDHVKEIGLVLWRARAAVNDNFIAFRGEVELIYFLAVQRAGLFLRRAQLCRRAGGCL
jgi:hypothetical protein